MHNKTRTKHTHHTQTKQWRQQQILNQQPFKPEKNKLERRLLYASNVSSWGNNQIYKHTVMKQRKWLSTRRQP